MPKPVILVPHLNEIEPKCKESLQKLETEVKVWRRRGASVIDIVRSQMISEALKQNYDVMMFIDADVGFNPEDAISLLARPEPVICGVYPVKRARRFTSVFDVPEVTFGKGAPESYPLIYAATGFLKIDATVLRRMIDELKLPLCDTKWGTGFWPFFQTMIIPQDWGFHFLGDDWSFSHRCRQIGITPLADTRIRLFHLDGADEFGWEEAGGSKGRSETYQFRCNYG